MEQGYSKAHIPIFPRQYPLVHFSAASGVSSGWTGWSPNASVTGCCVSNYAHIQLYSHRYMCLLIYMHIHEFTPPTSKPCTYTFVHMPTIYTLMHICTHLCRTWKYTYALTCIHTYTHWCTCANTHFPIFQQKGLCTYGQTIYAYTILYYTYVYK